LVFEAATGATSARGSALQYFFSGAGPRDYATVKIPGRILLSSPAIEYMQNWSMEIVRIDTAFEARVLDDRGYTYVFSKGADAGQAEPADWDGCLIPLIEVKDECGAAIRRYDYEPVPGMPCQSRITRQYTDSPTGPELLYHYDTLGQLTAVSSSAGRALQLGYDEYDRLTSYSHGGCPSCGGTVVLNYPTYSAGAQWNELATQRIDAATGSILESYEYDAAGRVAKLGRGGVDAQDPGYVPVYEALMEIDEVNQRTVTTHRFYVNGSDYEQVVEVDAAQGGLVSRTVWTGLNGTGLQATTTFTTVEVDPNLGKEYMTQLPLGNVIMQHRYPETGIDWPAPRFFKYRSSHPPPVVENDYSMLESAEYRVTVAGPKVSRHWGPYAGETDLAYDSTYGMLTRRIDPLPSSGQTRRMFEYEYDFPRQRITKQRITDGTTVRETSYEYDDNGGINADAAGNLTRVIEDSGPTGEQLATVYEYNDYNELTRRVDPSGSVEMMQYDVAGRLTHQYTLAVPFAPNGAALAELAYQYDASGRLTYTYERSTLGTATPVADVAALAPSNVEWHVIAYEYDVFGRRTASITDPAGVALRTTYAYDNQDRIVRVVQPNGAYTRTIRDGRGLEVRLETGYMDSGTEMPVSATCYAYDVNGNLTKMTEPSGRTSVYEFDGYDIQTKTVIKDGVPCL